MIDLIKIPKYVIFGQVVNIYIPLPKITCSNWNDWEKENIGVIYKDKQFTLGQMQFIINRFENKENREVSKLLQIDLTFDGFQITLKDILEFKRIFEDVKKHYPKDKYTHEHRKFNTETKLIL